MRSCFIDRRKQHFGHWPEQQPDLSVDDFKQLVETLNTTFLPWRSPCSQVVSSLVAAGASSADRHAASTSGVMVPVWARSRSIDFAADAA